MTTLNDYQFELLPSEAATDGIVFGIGSGAVDMEDGGFIPGDDDWTVDDQPDAFNGGMRFGNDLLNGPVHGFDLFTNCSDLDSALTALSDFKTAWRAQSIRNTPSSVLPCRYSLNGRLRRFYGRPRRFSAPPTNLISSGFVPITVDFQAVDAFFYDDAEETATLSIRELTGDSNGGFVFDRTTGIIFPVVALPVGTGNAAVVVGGDADAYPIIRIDGPVSNPSIQSDTWTIQLTIDLPDGEYIEIDTRPWKRTVLLNGTQSVGGALGGYYAGQAHQSIADAVMTPGPMAISFWGTSSSGSPTCTIRWRNTYNSY